MVSVEQCRGRVLRLPSQKDAANRQKNESENGWISSKVPRRRVEPMNDDESDAVLLC